MSFTHPTPEPKPWERMSDEDRRAYWKMCREYEEARRPYEAFLMALAQKRGVVHEPMGEGSVIKATGAGVWAEGGGGSGSHITHGAPNRQLAQ